MKTHTANKIRIRGTVRSSVTGCMLNGFRVIARDEQQKIVADMRIDGESEKVHPGSFELELLINRNNVFFLEVEKPGFYSTTKSVQIGDEAEFDMNFFLI